MPLPLLYFSYKRPFCVPSLLFLLLHILNSLFLFSFSPPISWKLDSFSTVPLPNHFLFPQTRCVGCWAITTIQILKCFPNVHWELDNCDGWFQPISNDFYSITCLTYQFPWKFLQDTWSCGTHNPQHSNGLSPHLVFQQHVLQQHDLQHGCYNTNVVAMWFTTQMLQQHE